MTAHRSLLTALAPAALALHAHAQMAPGGNHVPGTPSYHVDNYGTLVAGDLNHDLTPEVAVIGDSYLFVFQNPAVWSDSAVVAADAIDVCYVPCTTPPELVYTTSTGLSTAVFDGTHYVTAPVPGFGLAGAKRVVYARDGSVDKLFFAYNTAPANQPVVYGFYSSTITAGVISAPTQLFTLASGLNVLDFTLLDYWTEAGDTGLDLAILHSSGLHIRKQNGSAYLTRGSINPGDAIAALHHPASTGLHDSVAWITRLSANTSYLIVLNHGFAPSLSVQLTSTTGQVYTSAVAVDANADGVEDIALGNKNAAAVDIQILSSNTTNAASFFLPRQLIAMSDVVNLPPMGRIASANFFNDWSPTDVAIPGFAAMLTNAQVLSVMPGLVDDGDELLPTQQTDYVKAFYDSAPSTVACPATPPGETPRARWRMKLGTGWGAPVAADHIEIIVRRCSGTAETTDQTALAHKLFDIPSSPHQIDQMLVDFLSGLEETQGANWNLDELPARYFVQARPIDYDESSPPNELRINRAWRWSILGMSASCPGYNWIRSRTGAGTQIDTELNVCVPLSACNPPASSSMSFGQLPPAAVPQSNIPPTTGNVMPIVNWPAYNN